MPIQYPTTPAWQTYGLGVRRTEPAPIVKPKTTTVSGAPTTVANPSVLNPAPQAGQGPYGKVPGPIEYPTTPYAEATRIYPGMTALTPQAMEEIRSQIAGEFTPAEENALWDVSNRFGVQSGMPGAQLWSNRFMGNRIDEGMKRRQQGVENYGAILNILSKLGVDPNLAAEIAGRNATMNAAPDPEAATKALEAAYRNAAVNPAGGTLKNPIGTNTYGQGFRSPALPAWRNEPVNPYNPNPFAPNAPNPYAVTTPPADPNAEKKYLESTDEEAINAWLYLIDPVAAGLTTIPVEFGDSWGPSEDYGMDYVTSGVDPFNFYGPTEEEQLDWIWNQGGEESDPWNIYDQG